MLNTDIDKIEYAKWIKSIKAKIHKTRIKVALTLNSDVLELYWSIGKDIYDKQLENDWGSKIIDQISIDLRCEFPNIKGFSKRNIYAMRQWYLFYYQRFEFMPRIVAQIPWGQNRLIISKTKDLDEALFYAYETANNNWSRDILEIQINDDLYKRRGKAITNFNNTLPKKQSSFATNILKDPYNFDFLGLENSALKKESDNPSIGILLCKKKDKIEAEYSLRDINKPLGISEYRLTEAIPENMKSQLPSIEELENKLI